MGILVEEVREWNSPAIGAYLLWRFTSGYYETQPNGDAPVALLHFMAAPILTSKQLLEPVSRRRANLQSYVSSFEASKSMDILFSVHERVRKRREFTMAAIDIAVSTGLVAWDSESGKIFPQTNVRKPRRGNALRRSTVRDGEKAEILGNWFSEHDVTTIAAYLKVVL